MLIPIRHENMSARRWPVITIALIAINVLVFLGTHSTIDEQAPQLARVRVHILILAAAHPELNLPSEEEQLVDSLRHQRPTSWKRLQEPNHPAIDAWDSKIRLVDDPQALQSEMDSLTTQYSQLSAASIAEQYAFIPAHPKPLAYLTANFLHGGWMHLIGNMWFLWLAGFVLEDVWGRTLYSVFYLVAGVAALQFYAWSNPGSVVPTLGASGAVAALMGAFLVRFPKMKIEMAWLFMFRLYRFKAAAYWLLPMWLGTEVLYGSICGNTGGVAHWAHVGGFAFGALAAVGLRESGFEQKATKAIEAKVEWTTDPEIVQATDLIEKGQLDQAATILNNYLAVKPDSVDACSLLRQIYRKKNDLPTFHDATIRLCGLHLKAHDSEAAWQDYEEFLSSGGSQMPVGLWSDLCRVAEDQQNFERALSEYEKLVAAYPSERQAIMAQLAAGRICLKRLNRPQDALRFFQAASVSLVPHLDLETNIQTGIREASVALSPEKAKAATAGI